MLHVLLAECGEQSFGHEALRELLHLGDVAAQEAHAFGGRLHGDGAVVLLGNHAAERASVLQLHDGDAVVGGNHSAGVHDVFQEVIEVAPVAARKLRGDGRTVAVHLVARGTDGGEQRAAFARVALRERGCGEQRAPLCDFLLLGFGSVVQFAPHFRELFVHRFVAEAADLAGVDRRDVPAHGGIFFRKGEEFLRPCGARCEGRDICRAPFLAALGPVREQ